MTLTIPLPAVRSYRAMLRRLVPGRSHRPPCPFVYLQAGPQGLVLGLLMVSPDWDNDLQPVMSGLARTVISAFGNTRFPR